MKRTTTSAQAIAAPEASPSDRTVPGPGARRPVLWTTRRALAAAFTVIFSMVFAYAAICGYVALKATQPDRLPIDVFPEQFGLRAEVVTFPSRVDAVPLEGWL